MEYAKPWLSIDDQIERLVSRGVRVDDREAGMALLREVGYYRLTGYLYPFRESERFVDESRERVRVLNTYKIETRIEDAGQLIAFDRALRMLVLEGVERIEIALRMQLGYVLGLLSAFAHEDTSLLIDSFIQPRIGDGELAPSRHSEWLTRVKERQQGSDEAFVAHFRQKYDDRMPIWALTEILELGHIARLYGGLRNDIASEIAASFNVPTKRLMASWIATVNYVRNIAAHHARLFNRKLVIAPQRPRAAQVPLLAHLSDGQAPKEFGVYSALAVMAYLLRSIAPADDWAERTRELSHRFPKVGVIDARSMGIAPGWLDEELWRSRRPI